MCVTYLHIAVCHLEEGHHIRAWLHVSPWEALGQRMQPSRHDGGCGVAWWCHPAWVPGDLVMQTEI